MDNKQWETADIFNRFADAYCRRFPISPDQLKAMTLIKICRTKTLGGHLQACDRCGYEKPFYNSCRNRHCPKCQTTAKERWLAARQSELLPCGYFHLVFTLPHDLNPLIMANKSVLLSLLFHTVNQVLQDFAQDPKWRLCGKLGVLSILHTWSQTLIDHFHIHCLIPAGALKNNERRWISSRKRYLFGKVQQAKAFKHRYIKALVRLYEAGKLQFPGNNERFADPNNFGRLIHGLRKKNWVVYAKRPFAGPEKVLDYLGRYTHRVAISNHRIKSVQNDRVTFTYKDRKDDNKTKQMTVDASEFIRRFLLHILPEGFVKIRYFGFLAHRNKKRCIALIRRLMDPAFKAPQRQKETVFELMQRLTGADITCCPKCGKAKLKSKPLPDPIPIRVRGSTAVPVMSN